MLEEKETKDQLDKFLCEVKEELTIIIEKKRGELPEQLWGHFVEAWKETENVIDTAREQLSEKSEKDLEKVGLSGNSLKLKLAGFKLAVTSGMIIKRLGWMNIILGSLCRVLPVLEPVKEFKEALEESLS